MRLANFLFRVEIREDSGQAPTYAFDTDAILGGLLLSGWKVKHIDEIMLAASAVDQVVPFTDAICILLMTADNEFSLRLVAAQAQLTNQRVFFSLAHDTLQGVHTTSVLLSGNGTTPSQIYAIILEKP